MKAQKAQVIYLGKDGKKHVQTTMNLDKFALTHDVTTFYDSKENRWKKYIKK